MDEVVITIRGKKHWLWRAIDARGDILDTLLQTLRNAKAARWLFQRLVGSVMKLVYLAWPMRVLDTVTH